MTVCGVLTTHAAAAKRYPLAAAPPALVVYVTASREDVYASAGPKLVPCSSTACPPSVDASAAPGPLKEDRKGGA